MRTLLAAAPLALLAACASDRVTLLDNEDGAAQFAVADITRPGRERIVDRQNSELRLRGNSSARALKKVRASDTELVRGLPPRAARFAFTFPPESFRIPEAQKSQLALIRDQLLARGAGAQIEVVGYTDSTGADANNDRLSQQRAQAVAQELRELGFPIGAEDAVGRGEDEARQALGDGVASEAYRKVEVIVR